MVSSAGTIVDWCHFSHFEQISEEEWRLVFIITKPYYYIVGEDNVRYGYVTGMLYGKDDGLCKKLKIDDDIRIRQEGCLFEAITSVSDSFIFISQACDFIDFINTTDIVNSNCSDEFVELISNPEIGITQECEEVTLLISYETTLNDVCGEITQLSSPIFIIKDTCQFVYPVSNTETNLIQKCDAPTPLSNNVIAINQGCNEFISITYYKTNP